MKTLKRVLGSVAVVCYLGWLVQQSKEKIIFFISVMVVSAIATGLIAAMKKYRTGQWWDEEVLLSIVGTLCICFTVLVPIILGVELDRFMTCKKKFPNGPLTNGHRGLC